MCYIIFFKYCYFQCLPLTYLVILRFFRNMRIDTLAQMLSYCNVQSGGNFAVYEAGINGLITAAVLQRMGTEGVLINIFSGDFPHRLVIATHLKLFSTSWKQWRLRWHNTWLLSLVTLSHYNYISIKLHSKFDLTEEGTLFWFCVRLHCTCNYIKIHY